MPLYNYTMANITSGLLNPTRLRKEILSDATIAATECIIGVEDDDIEIDLDVTLGDTSPLDTIMQNHSGDPCTVERVDIMNAVLLAAEQATQLPRLLNALDAHASVIAALDNYNYSMASARIDHAIAEGALIADDKTLIESKFPVGWDSL